MINPDPWSEWKAGKTDGESNPWTEYQNENPVKVSDLSGNSVDPLEAIAGGALATIIGKGIGSAVSAMFADGGYVHRRPKTEREAHTNRQRRSRLAKARGDLRLAAGGFAGGQDNEQAGNEAIVELAFAWKFGQRLAPDLARDPEVVSALAQEMTAEDAIQIIDEFLAFLQSGAENTMAVLASLSMAKGEAGTHAYSSDQQQPNGATQESTVDPEDGGVQLAGGGFLGGNMGIALGAGTDQWNLQREMAMQKESHDARMKLAKPELETLDEATAARRSSLAKQRAENDANLSMVPDETTNARLKLAVSNSDLTESTLGRLGRFKDDTAGGLAYLNKAGLSQYGGGTATGLAFDDKGANVTLADGRTAQIPQAAIDRGARSLGGKFDFISNKVTGDIVRTNDQTGTAEVVIPSGEAKNRPLSLAQEATNKQIEISRARIAGMSPEEIRRRTSKATDTGRPNEDYDPMLAQHVRLANKRKYGNDPNFDNFTPGAAGTQSAQQPAQQGIADRFAADSGMRGYKLGKQTDRGYEVMDANGRVIGHYK